MQMNKKNVEIRFENETVTNMESALITGKELGKGRSSTSMYIGPLHPDDLHDALFLANTGVIKILTEEMGVDLDDCDDFLLSAMSEALTYEWNVKRGRASDNNFSKVIKYRNN
jgi:hypothetical protein